MISVGDADHVWALDTSDKLYMRQETSSPAFPEVYSNGYIKYFLNLISSVELPIWQLVKYTATTSDWVKTFVLGLKLAECPNNLLNWSISRHGS